MKQFWTRYSYDVAKVFASRMIADFFAISLLAIGGKTDTLKFVIMAAAMIVHLFLIYSQVWKVGQHDALNLDNGSVKENKWTGLFIGLMAGIPDIIVFILTAINKFTPSEGLTKALAVIYFIYDGVFWPLLTKVIGGQLWFYAITFIPAALWCALTYYLGLRGVHYTKIFISETPEEREIKQEQKENRKH